METFPNNKIVPIKAKLSGSYGDASIEIFLKPFELELDDYFEDVETSIRLDTINIPIEPKDIQSKTFRFPFNPNPGYIDGSIYFFAAHNPIDVAQISFGKIENGKIPISLECNWVLEFEKTGFSNFKNKVETYIEL